MKQKKRNQVTIILLAISIPIWISCTNQTEKQLADLIIHNAKVWTANDTELRAEAFAIVNDKILDIGKNKQILKLKDENTTIIDAGGKLLLPGFIDSHVHFLSGGFGLSSVQLKNAASPEEFINRIKEFATKLKPGEWILEGNWDHENWGGELPTREWIDQYTKDNPVFINRSDGHMGLANTAALKIAGITRNVKDIPGGDIVRNNKGELTGVFKDNAMNLVYGFITDYTDEQKNSAMQSAMEYFASHGVTTVHNMGSMADIEVFDRARRKNEIITRIYSVAPLSQYENVLEKKKTINGEDNWLKIGGAKLFADGSLGSHTAAFFEPYTDLPSDTGLLIDSEENMQKGVIEADAAGLQVLIHAIGDRANNIVINMYEEAGKQNGDRDRRFRIEHAQHLIKSDIPRFKNLNIIASMQPYHLIDDGRWAEKIIGPERIKTTIALRSLLDAGATLAFGSDWPVAPAIPLTGIYAAVTRQTLDGKNPGGWMPQEKISVTDALKAYTINAAYASFDEHIKGSLEPGKLADFVILDKDIFNISPEKIKDVKVVKTFVGGRVVFSKN